MYHFIVFPFRLKPRHSDICPSGRQEQTLFGRGCNPFQIRTTHRAVLYVSSCVLKYIGRV
ncbi:hypothetical protein NEIPOLOT_02449 [Neisseria polysaccharea ATCC 43768]|nr:hypothetical protein NEIPOLOT_02449 [Neisseria polysaccharea ATCC 43768]